MYIRAGRPAFARPYVGVHRSTSLMSSSLLLQQCPACLVCLTCIVFLMGGRGSYSWCLVGCCRQDLFNIARSILDSYSLSISSIECKNLFIVINCLVIWSICLCFSLAHFKNDPEYLTNGTAKVYICYIIAEGFFILSFFVGYILSFGLVRLRTFRLCARVGARIERGRMWQSQMS